LRILRGEKPQAIPRVKDVTKYIFDWQALRRRGLKESNLPPGSIVLNRKPSTWESYKLFFIGAISLILAESLLIFGLVRQRARRREAEAQLAITFAAAQESEQRFRLVANTAPVMIWMSGPDKLCTYFNQPWLEFSGRPPEAELGNGWSERVHPEDLTDYLDTYTRAFDLRESFRMQKHSGERHFKVELSGTSSEIQLTVSDLGIGFDQQVATGLSGIGLISMRERLKLVGGEFSINSKPGGGTTIRARVPHYGEGASCQSGGLRREMHSLGACPRIHLLYC
jgi:PAS domain S-box-containing protein